LAGSLINDLHTIDVEFILILDDYHNIHAKEVHDLINSLLIYPPETMHLVLVTRRDPPFSVANLRVRGYITEIRMQQLRFSLSETKNYLTKVMKMDVDDHTAVAIDTKTEGWVAGLRLAVLSFREREDLNRIIANLPENNRYVMDYIISEVISHQPEDIQEYLISTAILDRFCAALCESICISKTKTKTCSLSGSAFIDHIESNNMFCIPLDDRRKWYRFHHLFADLLQRELKRRFGENVAMELHNRAGSWFAQQGNPDEAIQHMLSANNVEAARQIVIFNRYDLTEHEQWHRLERWMNALPKDSVDNDPALLTIQAWLHENRERVPEMLDVVERCEKLVSERPQPIGESRKIIGELNALKASHFYLKGDLRHAKEYADLAIAQIPRNHLSERAFALLVWAFTYQMEGNATEARRVVYDAMREDPTGGSTYSARLLLTLCFIDWLEGNFTDLQQHARQLLTVGRESDLLESKTFGNYHLGIMYYCLGDTDKALTYLNPAIQKGLLTDPNTYLHASCARALLYQNEGQSDKAHRTVREMFQHSLQSKNTALLQITRALNAEISLRQGNEGDALSWAREYAFDPLKQAVRFFVPQLTQAKILMTKGTITEKKTACDMLGRMHEFFGTRHNKHCMIEVCALKSTYLYSEGDQSAALSELKTALGLAYQSKRAQPFLSLGQDMARLLELVRNEGEFETYAGELLAAFGKYDSTQRPKETSSVISATLSTDPDQAGDNPLTNREIDIVQLLADRSSNKEIATKLYISPDTVKRHTINIYRKLSVHNRQDAVTRAAELGLLGK
jgi:LuxR family maltose regulon positive regulatory protein